MDRQSNAFDTFARGTSEISIRGWGDPIRIGNTAHLVALAPQRLNGLERTRKGAFGPVSHAFALPTAGGLGTPAFRATTEQGSPQMDGLPHCRSEHRHGDDYGEHQHRVIVTALPATAAWCARTSHQLDPVAWFGAF